MDAIRKIARAYYDRASEEEKNSAKAYFNAFDTNGNGKISLEEFKSSSISSTINREKLFKQLDANGDGSLDFYEALALYYIANNFKGLTTCSGCHDVLVGHYFSCLLCIGNYPKTVDLCRDCYRGGKFEHEHDSSNFLDHHSLPVLLRGCTSTQTQKNQEKLDGIRKIASAYYNRASEDEKNDAKAFFKTLDANGDGKVSLAEFKASSTSWLNNEKLFKQLDTNGDGTLDYHEALALYYMAKKTRIPKCDGCCDLLVGPYFSCLPCQAKSPNTCDLCCDCYHEGKFKHEHASNNFLDHHTLLMLFRYNTTDAHKNQRKQEMDELREIAKAHYRAGSPEVQELAHNFFNSLDADGDEHVNLPEFLSFSKQEGHAQMLNPHFFKELDRDGDGTLDFWEVMTLYYIIKSGRPFCDWCGSFIAGIFFSCVECYKKKQGSFNLCRDCYSSENCKHNHNGKTQFLDIYTLLQAQKDSALAQAAGLNHTETNNTYYVILPSTPEPNSSTAIVPAALNLDKWNVTLKALEVGLNIGNMAATLCSIL